MSEPSLNQLEREVEAARARLASDLATLRAPSTFSEFTSDLKAEALDTKDAMVEKAKSSVQSSVQGFVDELKAKAAANPGAVLAIGAGIAWRLFQRPPIATVLVGAGLYSLFKTPQGSPESPYYTRATEMAEQAVEYGGVMREQAVELAATAREKSQEFSTAAQQAAADIRERTAAAAQQVSAALHDARDSATALAHQAADRVDSVRHQAQGLAAEASDMWRDARRPARDRTEEINAIWDAPPHGAGDFVRANRDDGQNTLLLGAAGLAIAAAVGIAMQRRGQDTADVD
jgi:hypothetical protein